VADRLLGLLGGTFDPLHIGHLRTALDVREALALSEVHLIPNNIPAHREQPVLPAQQRFSLLETALVEVPGLVANDCEIKRGGISYMVDTLRHLRDQYASQHLCLIIGTDAYNSFCQWHQWQQILQLAHLVVMQRAGVTTMFNKELDSRITADVSDLEQERSGCVYVQPVCQLDVSSTALRAMMKARQSIQFLVPENIRTEVQNLYKV